MTKKEQKDEAKRRAAAKIADLLRRGVRLSKSDVRSIRSGEKYMVEMQAAGVPWPPKNLVIERERAVGRAVPIRASRARRANPEMVRQSRPVFEKPTHANVIHHAPVVVTKVANIRRLS